jgi:hypothetical protein
MILALRSTSKWTAVRSSRDPTGRMARLLIEWVEVLGELIPHMIPYPPVSLTRADGDTRAKPYARTAVHAIPKVPAMARIATVPYSRDRYYRHDTVLRCRALVAESKSLPSQNFLRIQYKTRVDSDSAIDIPQLQILHSPQPQWSYQM